MILGANQAVVAIIGFAAVLGAASLLSVPNALTAPSIDLANSIRFACAVGVFLILVGCPGASARSLKAAGCTCRRTRS